ncbi:MAG: 2OG-Fe(II) oxygenase [Thiolinea sp.]
MENDLHIDCIENILSALIETGWVELPGFLSNSQLQTLRELAEHYLQQGQFRQASIGSGNTQVSNPNIRSDQIMWLDEQVNAENAALADLQQFLDQLRLQINQALYLGLFETEVHFALYPSGGHYQKHIDNFHGRSSRMLTFILYLNDNWLMEQGGQLRLYTSETDLQSYTDIIPQGGTLVVFLSERFYHEVLPASRERLSLTGWLRRRENG